MELVRRCCWPKQCPLLCSIFLSVIGLWVKIWHKNKTACSKLNLVQSSRSKLTTCGRKGCLLRFKLNTGAAALDGDTQKLENYVWRDSESIATKVCSQISRKSIAMFERHVVTSVDETIFNFEFRIFLAICLCKHSSTVVLTNHQLLNLEDLS